MSEDTPSTTSVTPVAIETQPPAPPPSGPRKPPALVLPTISNRLQKEHAPEENG
ncbi:hypothetical protein CAEBREN_29671 [Caenorhabditis brenneri]|uniref:Uncharacterized protein n=1 Tax=Caenorhabditis brenneri TaxID=135651 RepID=G0NCI3_CAEBE|nr:hypothetical protein CAEBREN_29671 [Caenorhabditis brenneri]